MGLFDCLALNMYVLFKVIHDMYSTRVGISHLWDPYLSTCGCLRRPYIHVQQPHVDEEIYHSMYTGTGI